MPERGLRAPQRPDQPDQPDRSGARSRPLAALIAGVLLAHLLLANGIFEPRLGWGAGDRPAPRIEVAFVRALAAAPPPLGAAVAPPVAVPARLPAVAAKPQPAASSPAQAEEVAGVVADPTPAPALAANQPALAAEPPAPAPPPDRPPATAAPVPEPAAAAVAEAVPAPPTTAIPTATTTATTTATATATATAATAAATPAPTASAARFDWPPSTQLNYRLSGHYRGPIEGSARVEWLRQGNRYQVRMATSIGPVLSRHISSEGELTEAGLAPRRFDGEQKVLFRAARRWSLRFGPERIVLADGRDVATLPGAQDEASQFVQLTWLFTTRPDQLRVGQAIELPLIVGRTLDRWTYDVVAEELLRLPFGAVPTFHIKPRREAQGGDMTAEIWFAPSLQTLPVRILIRQNQDSWVDLTLDSPPLQAAEPAPLR